LLCLPGRLLHLHPSASSCSKGISSTSSTSGLSKGISTTSSFSNSSS
jgi:hypothetical protein